METLRSNDATATRTSPKKWSCVLPVFTVIIPIHFLWRKPLPGNSKFLLPVDVRRSKTSLLALPNQYAKFASAHFQIRETANLKRYWNLIRSLSNELRLITWKMCVQRRRIWDYSSKVFRHHQDLACCTACKIQHPVLQQTIQARE